MEKLKVTQILEQIMDMSTEEEEKPLIESVEEIFENEPICFETPILESCDGIDVELNEDELAGVNISKETLELIEHLKEEALELLSSLGE